MTADFKVEGMEELIKKVNELGAKAEKEKTNALKKGAEVLKKDIKGNIIKKGLVDSGALRDSIKVKVNKGKAKIGIVDLGDAYYRAFHEFGTTRLPARPFIQQSVEKFDEVQVVVGNYLKEVVLNV